MKRITLFSILLVFIISVFSDSFMISGFAKEINQIGSDHFADELSVMVSKPVFSQTGGIYRDSINIKISSEAITQIHYTTDGTVPDINSKVYDGSILSFTETTEIKAAAYLLNGQKSEIVSEKYYITQPLADEEVTINDEGVITSCITEKEDVYIPDTVNDIVPVKIGTDAFSQRNGQIQNVKVLLIPFSVKSIDDYAFYDNDSLTKISADGVTEIGENAFAYCDEFESIQASDLEVIGNSAFYYAGVHKNYQHYGVHKYSFFNVTFPSLKYVGESAFARSAINCFNASAVESIGQSAFSNSTVSSVICKSLSRIPDFAFYKCYNLIESDFTEVKSVGSSAFADNHSLVKIDMPVCNEIESCSFSDCRSLSDLNFPSLKRMAADSFDWCDNIDIMIFPELEEIYYETGGGTEVSLSAKIFFAPKLKSFCDGCFDGQFETIEIPSVEILDKNFGSIKTLKHLDISGCKEINSSTAFEYISGVDVVYAPNLIYANSLPDNSSVIVSSALNQIDCSLHDMTFYGISGSYAEHYANENNHRFFAAPYIDSSSIPESVSGREIIKIEAIGFNLKYQWYASFDERAENRVLLEGETDSSLELESAKKAPYYYCVVTCEENGKNYTAKTVMIHNTAYSSADYSALDAILATIPEDLSIYTDETVAALNEIINGIDRNLDATEQNIVDGYVEAVSKTIATLKLKDSSVSIKNYVNVRTVDYKTTITFTAVTNTLPDGASVVWCKDGQKIAEGEKFTAKEATETFMIQAKIADEFGNVLSSSKTELVKVKTNFFSKIIAFFRMIIGRLPAVEQ